MIYTHIFLVMVVTVVLIFFAEYQKLRKISWILFIGCVTYIILIIEPEKAQPTNINNVEFAAIDSTPIIRSISQTTDLDTVVKGFIVESKNTNIMDSDESNFIDETQNLKILTLSIATDIVEKIPFGISRLFFNDIGILYCYTEVDNTVINNKIIHSWRHNEQDYFKSIIRVGDSPHWRCWSRITIRPEMIGNWQVIVTDTIGTQLGSIEFSIIPTSE
ncbi:DUF2914 domain-containing protein [Candidatus Neomarinimicrobiota bacterium]